MSNTLSIQTTAFTNYYANGEEETSFGYRIYDDYDKNYNNLFESLQEALDYCIPENLEEIMQENGFENDIDCYSSIEINGEYFDPNEVL